jgi:hypothetical protein
VKSKHLCSQAGHLPTRIADDDARWTVRCMIGFDLTRKELIMSKRIAISSGLLIAALAIPLQAQGVPSDLTKFNFNIGGGIDTPLNPIGRFVGVSGDFQVGAGYSIDKHNSIGGEFGWTGLPSNIGIQPVLAPSTNINLYTLTANYRPHVDRIGGSALGVYAIMGGGWYYRHFTVDKNFVVPPNTVCQPIYVWYGFGCTGGVVSAQIFSKGSSSGGVNGGVGLTVRLGDSGWKFYMESRYHYAFTNFIHTAFVPVTLGIRFN